MRISVFEDDPGHAQWTQASIAHPDCVCVVYVDGVEIKGGRVQTADEEKGFAFCNVLEDPNDLTSYKVDKNNNYVHEFLRGKVEIKWEKRLRV